MKIAFGAQYAANPENKVVVKKVMLTRKVTDRLWFIIGIFLAVRALNTDPADLPPWSDHGTWLGIGLAIVGAGTLWVWLKKVLRYAFSWLWLRKCEEGSLLKIESRIRNAYRPNWPLRQRVSPSEWWGLQTQLNKATSSLALQSHQTKGIRL